MVLSSLSLNKILSSDLCVFVRRDDHGGPLGRERLVVGNRSLCLLRHPLQRRRGRRRRRRIGDLVGKDKIDIMAQRFKI